MSDTCNDSKFEQGCAACINCGRDESELPISAWHMADQTFWICPDCLPLLIHRRAEVMPAWGLIAQSEPSSNRP